MSAIHIACAADEKFLPHCAAMLHSVFETTTGVEIVVHFLHFPDFPEAELAILSEFVEGAGAQLDKLRVDAADLVGLPRHEYLPLVVWQRVLLPRLLPSLDKVLYLDSDAIALGSLKPLWDLDIGDHYLAAVANPMHEEMAAWPEAIGLPNAASYFNDGIMLLNLKLMREHGCADKILQHAREHPELIHWAEQCAMNAVLHSHRYPLDPKWNMMNNFLTRSWGEELFPPGTLAAAIADPQLIHFEGAPQTKPWQYRSDHPYRNIYLRHRSQTPWPLAALEGRTPANFVKKHLPQPLLVFLRQLWQARSRSTGTTAVPDRTTT